MSKQNVESLECRKLLAVSMGSDGYTKITPSSDSKLIYVSTSGSDNNAGTIAKPVKTIAQARKLIRDLKPDWVLLKRGDTFNESFGGWTFSGRSAQEPSVITSYGSGARPKIFTGTAGGITLAQKYSNPLNHAAVIGLHFFPNTYNGKNGTTKTAGIRVMQKGSNVLLEDNLVQGYKDNIVIDPTSTITGVKIRRNVIIDAWNNNGGRAQGIYGGAHADNVLIEENVIDHNGWKEGPGGAGQTMFNHSIYFNTGSTGLVVRGNIITRSSLFGVMSRGGAVVENNLLVRNPVAVQVGGGNSTVQNNVILEGNDLGNVQQLGKGIEAYSMSKLIVRKNVIAHDVSAGRFNNIAVNIRPGVGGGEISSNVVYDWNIGLKDTGKISVSGNQITLSKDLGKGSFNYVDPNRSIAKYGGSLSNFYSSVRMQQKGAWNTKFTAKAVGDYVRAGFATKSSTSIFTRQATTSTTTQSLFSDTTIGDGTWARVLV